MKKDKNNGKVPFNNGKNNKNLFEMGNPGGPGRPTGSRNRATLALESLGDDLALRAYKEIEKLAFSDDPMLDASWQRKMKACQFILDNVSSAHRPALKLALKSDTAGEIAQSQNVIIDALAEGEIDMQYADCLTNKLKDKGTQIVWKELEDYVNQVRKRED